MVDRSRVHHPYALDPDAALAAAQSALTATWCALLWGQRRELGLCIAGGWALAFGLAASVPWLGFGAWLSSVALMLVVLPAQARWIGALALAIVSALHFADPRAGALLSVATLAIQAACVALLLPARAAQARRSSFVRHDLALFSVGLLAGAWVSHGVFARSGIMDDEWAYTFQADLFAHLRAYAPSLPCASPYDNNWLFTHEGRTFSQFTPGWPLFMAPFVRLGMAWLASPVCLGLLMVGVARVARRVAADQPGWAGAVAAFSAAGGASALLNAGSRYSHVFVAAMFAWAVEAACALLEAPGSRRASLTLGACAAWMIAARPADGALLASGIALVLARERPRATLALITFALGCGLALLILRVQLGVWFQTGYALTDSLRPWATFGLSLPARDAWSYALPLGVGAFCWWPCSPALGVAGLVSLRRTPAAWMLSIGALALLGFYVFVDFARMDYWAYGPRYQLPLVVPLSVGGAVWLTRTLRGALAHSGVTVSLGATILIGMQLYPALQREAQARTALWRALRRDGLHHAVVWVGEGDLASHATALTQNFASDLEPDVIVLVRGDHATEACARTRYPDRAFYRALGRGEVTLVRE
jgi:hypothetical protein